MGLNPLASIPIFGGFLDDSDNQALSQLRRTQDLMQGIKTPEFKDYSPEELKWLQDYAPEMMQAKTVSEDPLIRSAQMASLSKLSGLADTGLSDVDQAGYMRARQEGAQLARQGTDAAIQNAAARHVGGSGMEYALREMAGQGGAERAQQAGLQQAADSARNRAMYQQAYLSGLGNLRQQDYGVNAANTGILNAFNQANTQNRNAAQMYNLQGRQDLSNQNVGQRNYAQQYNNQLKQQQFQDQMNRAAGIAGANTGVSNGLYAQNAANTASRNQMTGAAMAALGGGGFSGMAGAYGVKLPRQGEEEEE